MGYLDARSSQTNSSSDEDLKFILGGIPMYPFSPNEKDCTFFSMNKVCYQITDHFLVKYKDIFNTLESIRSYLKF